MAITKTMKVVIVEIAMLGGIVGAMFTIPESTPLRTFLFASGACFLAGNTMLFIAFRKKQDESVAKREFWPRILLVFAVLAMSWIVILLLRLH